MKGKALLILIHLILFTIAVLIIIKYTPKYNWDILPYTAIAKSYFTDDSSQIHLYVFEDLRYNVPDHVFDRLVSGSDYGKKIFEDATYFTNQLPFYQIKPLYPLILATLHTFGFSIVKYSIVVSKVCIILSMIVAYILIFNKSNMFIALEVTFFVFSSQQVAAFSSWSTPDPMFSLLLLMFFYIFYLLSIRRYRFVYSRFFYCAD